MAVSLPKTSAEFSDPNYWKKFFAIHKSPFEWYGDHSSLGLVLDKYLKTTDDILQVGCGNSQLAGQLHDVGYKNILSIDTNSSVITEQLARNRQRASLKFEVRSATETGLESESMNVVLDKGTLDALLPPDNEDAVKIVKDMFQELTRVLRVGGRYVVVTLAQEHIVRQWTSHFHDLDLFLLRIHKIENTATGFPMPVFILIATKLREKLKITMPIEFARTANDKPTRLTNVSEILEAIEAEQQLSRFVHLCSKTLTSEVSIITSSVDCNERYKFYIVDDTTVAKPRTFSVFVVPIGRDCDWLFATEKGRKSLRAQCQKDRLAIVVLNRDAKYESLSAIKDELASFVLRLNPVVDENGKVGRVEFLSMGEHDVKRTVATGVSTMNGKWSVEDVVIRDKEYRRLVFLASQNLVQSEAPIKIGKKDKRIISQDELSCEHHEVMLLSLALLTDSPLLRPDKVPLKVAVLGLGGGLLAAFLIRHFGQMKVTGVELDPDVVQIASKYFYFPYNDNRMGVRVMDALDYLKETSANGGVKQDAIFVDLASAMSEEGLSCPPPLFLSHEVLQMMHDSLSDGGVLALNLVTRDEEVSDAAKKKVSEHFPSLCVVSSQEDVNEVLIASKKPPEGFDKRKFARSLNKDRAWLASIAKKIEKLIILN